ncbi:50S ribosomal protein L19 [Patescibacteria group bacterium]|nr:MAG: 50S ribosomal protein L19 [Patescibacteria group bacterium]
MHKKIIEFNKALRTKEMPEIKSGDVVKVRRRFVDGGKETTQLFEGIVIAVKGRQSSSPTITVRKVSHGVGVELVLPIFSPLVKSVEVVKRAKVRRSKLYYIREKSAKSLKMKYKELSSLIAKEEEEKPAAKEEAAKAE